MREKKIWLITGISSGLGQALAQSVMENGDFVIGTFRQTTQLETFNRQNEGRGKAFLMDLSSPASIEDAVGQIQKEFNRLDVLTNNAGAGMAGAIEESTMQEVRDLFEVNFFGTLKLTQEILPIMRAKGKGHIVQISSHGGIKAFPGFGIYNASKFALEGFSEAMAQEVAPLGIKVTLVEPGPFRTQFAGPGLKLANRRIADYDSTAGQFRTKLKGVHGKQEGDPQKAAQAIIELVKSPQPPLRLPLGKTALATIGMKLESVRDNLERARKIASETVF